jgi:hypothetical protein
MSYAFPTPHTVQHEAFNGSGIDELGNDVETWSSPVNVRVIGFAPSSQENITGYTSRVVSDVDMAVPPELSVSLQDRFTIPEYGKMDVVAVEDANHGFHGWTPGNIVKLKQVTG